MKKVEMNVKLQLAADDCQRLAMKAAGCGLTVSELLENFVNDLVCGAATNGSDERMYAEQWFERCWFSYEPQKTFLKYLIDWDLLEEFLEQEACRAEYLDDINWFENNSLNEREKQELKIFREELAKCEAALQELFDEYTAAGGTEEKALAFKRVLDWQEALEDMKGEM